MRYDLIIVGGGLVGAGLAVALQNTGLQIALIDARLPDNNDPRLFALNHYSCQFLTNLGTWPALQAHAAAIHQVHVSHQGHFGAVRLNREDAQLASLGHVIPAKYIEAALNDKLATLTNFNLYRPAKFKKITQHENDATLLIEKDGEEIELHSAIVIAADGADSMVRDQLHIPTTSFDYQQSAIVTRTQLKRPHKQIAYERFTTEGAIAMLPLAGDECATIWTVDNAIAASLMVLDDAAFLAKLQQTFGYRLGQLQSVARRHTFPLRLVHAEKMVAGSVLLLGNSAHAMHPIAAQGFNLALYEVAALVDGILQKRTANQMFTAQDLYQIHTQVASHQADSVKMSHRLARIFSNQSALMSCALSLGMAGLDAVPLAKTKFINMMIGSVGSLPSLLMSTQDI